MHLIKDHLRQSETEPTSPVFQKKDGGEKFVPFRRERDSMNRLISAQSSRKK